MNSPYPTTSSYLQTALALNAQCLSIIPIDPSTWEPLLNNGENNRDGPPLNENQIIDCWNQRPDVSTSTNPLASK